MIKTIQDIREKGLIIFECISGSYAYGTAIPGKSDRDTRGVFVLPQDELYGLDYIEQINDETNDVTFYEVKRFIELLQQNNPNILELLHCPNDCIVYKHPVFDLLLENKEKFISKICKNSISGYASTQIKKAKGLDKKQNWEKDRVTRKTPLDFCYAMLGEKTIPINKFLEQKGMDQKFCGLVATPHGKDMYAMFYDWHAHKMFSTKVDESVRSVYKKIGKLWSLAGKSMGYGFKGIAFEDSNQIRLSSVPKNIKAVCNVYYNKDGYQMHCKDFLEYEDWLKNRNINRWTDFQNSKQQIDGKNMLHSVRLVEMAREIAEGKGVNVRRDNAEYLLSIRRGEVKLEDLISWVEKEIEIINKLFDNSNLPKNVDKELCNDLLIRIRKNFYQQ